MSSFRRRLMRLEQKGKYIKFEDPEVERICIANWSSDGVGLTYEDAERVTSISNVFRRNTAILSFNEFEYFTNVKSIANFAFNGCTGLSSIKFNDNIESIGEQSFSQTPSLAIDINLPNLKSLHFKSFNSSGIVSITNLGEVSNIPSNCFNNCKNLSIVNLPDSCTVIGTSCFTSCSSLNYINLHRNITSIGEAAFADCKLLSIIINLPNLNKIAHGSFDGADIKKIEDLGSVQTFGGNNCFAGNKNLYLAILPSTLTSLNAGTFAGCSSLQTVILNSTTPPAYDRTFSIFPSTLQYVYVPDESIEVYMQNEKWSGLYDKIKPLSEYVES